MRIPFCFFVVYITSFCSYICRVKSVLEDAAVREMVYPISVEAYHMLASGNKRTELIQGIIFNKMPKSPLHANTLRLVHKALAELLHPAYELVTENPITLGDSEPEPDILITDPLKSIHDPHPNFAYLIVEISINTKEYDRAKSKIYAAGKIPVYWNILPEERVTIVYSQPEADRYLSEKRISFSETLTLALPNQQIDLSLENFLK